MLRALLSSPARNILVSGGFVFAVATAAAFAYVEAGWTVRDAIYMVVLTVFTVGYGEVEPVDTGFLRAVTLALILLGCTGMILVSGAVVQFFTSLQIQQVLGSRRMIQDIDRLRNHVVVCGFGRLGQTLCRELRAGQVPFVVVERGEAKCDDARRLGYLLVRGEAEGEEVLRQAGIARARALATVVPNDSANVFITLSARSLSRDLLIVARGEAPSTENKLRQAGADEVVLPAFIGAERVAELVLYHGATRDTRNAPFMRQAELGLRRLGLEMELVIATAADFAGRNVAEVEDLSGHAFFVVAIERQGGADVERPDGATRIEPGDGVVIVGRSGRARMLAAFAPAAQAG